MEFQDHRPLKTLCYFGSAGAFGRGIYPILFY